MLAEIVDDALGSWFDADLLADHLEAERAERVQMLRALPRGKDNDDDEEEDE